MASDSRLRDQHGTSEAEILAIIGEEVSALRLEAIAALDQKNSELNAAEHFNITEASLGACGSPTGALRNIIAHLPSHDTQAILECYRQATEAGLPEDVLLTNDHITVCTALDRYRADLIVQGETSSFSYTGNAEYRSIMSHALSHIEDGHFIVSLYVDRGIRTHREILDFLPALKAISHQVLTEGTL